MGRYESPEYTVKMKEDPFELREYRAFFIIEYENPEDPSLDAGFGTLFRYISDYNEQNEKISMTVPVIKEKSSQGMKMAFVVPKEKWERIPQPKDTRLKITKFESGIFATLTYGGASTKRKEEVQIALLEQWLLTKQYVKKSNFMVAIYNGPYILPVFRRNEVMVRIE